MLSPALVKYVLTAALRDRLLLSSVAVIILGICLSLFLASSAVIEQNQFALVYMGSGLRVLTLAGLVLFVVFFIRRSFDARDIEYLLSRPVSRISLILSNAAAFSLLAIGAGVFLTLILGGMAWRGSGEVSGVLLWSAGITGEFIIMVNVALFFAMVLSSPVTAGMAALGFYILARMMGELLGITVNPPFHFAGDQTLMTVMKVVSVAVPRLDLMAQTSWLVYGTGGLSDYFFIICQALAFLILILTASLIDLVRRQF